MTTANNVDFDDGETSEARLTDYREGWAVYRADGGFAVVHWLVSPSAIVRFGRPETDSTLEAARKRVPAKCVRIERTEQDPDDLVESWA